MGGEPIFIATVSVGSLSCTRRNRLSYGCYLEDFIAKPEVIVTEKRHHFRIPGQRTAAGRELGRVSGDGRPVACRITEPRHWACTSDPERQLTATTAVWEGALITASGKFAFSNAQLHRAQLILGDRAPGCVTSHSIDR